MEKSSPPIDSLESPAMVMPKDPFIQEVLADVAKTHPEQARAMAKMAVEREKSRELRNLLRLPFAIGFGAPLLIMLVAAAVAYAFGGQSDVAQYFRVGGMVMLIPFAGWAIFSTGRD